MNILFVSAVLPYPLHSGGQIRIFHLLKTLSRKHTITLFTYIRRHDEKKFAQHLGFLHHLEFFYRGYGMTPRNVIRSAVSSFPLLMTTYRNRQLWQRLSQEIQTRAFDVIHLEPFYVLPALPATCTAPLVIGEHNIEYEVYRRYVRHSPYVLLRPFMYADVLKLQWWERCAWRKADSIVAVSHRDKEIIASVAGADAVTVVPNGVDTGQFAYTSRKVRHDPAFLFVGNFRWVPNQDAVEYILRDIWPGIKKSIPNASLRIIGTGLSSRLQTLIQKMGITVNQHVDDISQEYRRANVLLAPVRIAGGTKFKILEALATGLPVVTTTEGIVGLDVRNHTHVLVADSPEKTIEACKNLIEQPERFREMTVNGRRIVEEMYSWTKVSAGLDDVWRKAYEKTGY